MPTADRARPISSKTWRGRGLHDGAVSYDKWTSALDRTADERPEFSWSAPDSSDPRRTRYTFLKHQPGQADRTYVFTVRRQQTQAELFARYAYTVGEAGIMDPQLFMEKHPLKGACERGFTDLLSPLDLHHPPCSKLIANPAFYALGIMVHNLLQAFKLIEREDHGLSWTLRSVIFNVIQVPASLSDHANVRKVTFSLSDAMLKGFRQTIQKHFPPRGPGRPRNGS